MLIVQLYYLLSSEILILLLSTHKLSFPSSTLECCIKRLDLTPLCHDWNGIWWALSPMVGAVTNGGLDGFQFKVVLKFQ